MILGIAYACFVAVVLIAMLVLDRRGRRARERAQELLERYDRQCRNMQVHDDDPPERTL